MFDQVDKAIRTGKKMHMIYLTHSRRLSQRTVQIISRTEKTLIAYCHLRRQVRTFKMENILALEICDWRFIYNGSA